MRCGRPCSAATCASSTCAPTPSGAAYGWPPGAGKVSLLRHIAVPEGPDVVYLCQHANRSKLTGRSGAPEVAGGFAAWLDAGLPVEGGSS